MLHRLRLDRPRPSDAEAITRVLRDWQVTRWLPTAPWPYGSDDAADFIAGAGRDDHAIRLDGALIGLVRAGRDLEILVAPPFQRQGVALRASVLALTRVFNRGASQVAASHFEGNHRSAALLARLGFRSIGPRQLTSRAEGRRLPGRRLALSRGDFHARHGMALATPRLVIDGVRPGDMPDLRRIATTPEVARMLFLFHAEMAEEELRGCFPAETLTPPFRLVVRHEGAVAGSIGIGAGEWPSIWYFLDPTLAGRGLGAEMLAAFADEAMARFDISGLQAEVFDDNAASLRLLERHGFAVTGRAAHHSMVRGGSAPAVILRREVPAQVLAVS